MTSSPVTAIPDTTTAWPSKKHAFCVDQEREAVASLLTAGLRQVFENGSTRARTEQGSKLTILMFKYFLLLQPRLQRLLWQRQHTGSLLIPVTTCASFSTSAVDRENVLRMTHPFSREFQEKHLPL